ncbi:MAG: type I-C CRISPR-associated protein Cas7/Csd2, partial [Chloroflexota bacterium]
GDPDAGNLPRVDPETMQGLVTDVSLKRKVRDWVHLARGADEAYKIYVQSGGNALNTKHDRAYQALGISSTGTKQKREDVDKARDWMCANFFDIRMFGAVMTTGVNCGQVRGPLQLTFGRSIDTVAPRDLSITRVAITKPEDAAVVVADDGSGSMAGKNTEMGRKALIPYGLYRAHGFFSPSLASQTGVSEDDLALFWDALQLMWDADRSASRGLMACRGLYVFSHDRPLGNAPAHRLFETVSVIRRPEVENARAFTDYEVMIAEANIPSGVTLTRLEG